MVSTRTCLRIAAIAGVLLAAPAAGSPSDPLPSWNDGSAKRAILAFVGATTDENGPDYVPPARRVAAFDQDGTLWVEHPIYTQVVYAMARVAALAPKHPEWKTGQPFAAVLSGDRAAMAKFGTKDLEQIVVATHTGMPVEAFRSEVRDWIGQAKDSRWHRRYTELIYEPMLEVMRYMRANGYRTYIVTGGGQEFVRAYSDETYGVESDQVIGSAGATTLTYAKNGEAVLMKSPKLLLDDNNAGKAENIYLFIGQRPEAAFGNSDGDRQMLEYTQGNRGAKLMMLVLHDDPAREYAYGPADGLPGTKIGTFSLKLYDEATSRKWTVISMRRDWKRIFEFER